jgi:hypothetical protein
MPADDLVLNVRQIAGYTATGSAVSSDALLIQRGGLGGPYLSIDAQALVSTALEAAGPFSLGIPIPANTGPNEMYAGHYNTALSGGSGYNAYYDPVVGVWRYLGPGPAATLTFGPNAGWLFETSVAGSTGAALGPLDQIFAVSANGNATLELGTLTVARDPIAPLEVATARWVEAVVAGTLAGLVTSVQQRTGAVWLTVLDIPGCAPITSPFFSGEPRAPTPSSSSNSSRIATTAFVAAALAGAEVVSSFNGRTGAVVLTEQDILDAGGTAIFDSPTFTGIPLAPTATTGTNTAQVATCAFVNASIAASTIWAPLASPAFSGNPTAPTAAAGTSDGQIATTAFVMNAVTESTTGVVSFNTRTGAVVLQTTDVISAGGAPLASPSLTGVPLAPTATIGTSNTQIANTAFVAANSVASFNGRAGVVTLTTTDIVSAGGAPLASPSLTGNPTAPTASPGDADTSIANTAFVAHAITAAGGVTAFNGRTGSVTLIANDISAAGGAILASPAFTGAPTAPTAAPGNNSTVIATTAFVVAALAAGGGVTSFNGRAGAITLTAADVSAAGGPYLALSGGVLTGALTIGAGNQLNLDASAGTVRAVQGTTGGLARWRMALGNAAAESGSNAGSDFGLSCYNDAGVLLGTPLSIRRSDNLVNFNGTGAVPSTITGSPGACIVALNKASGGAGTQILSTNNGVTRWQMLYGDAALESGSNAGSNFTLNGMSDAGVLLGVPFYIDRAHGTVTVNGYNAPPALASSLVSFGMAAIQLNRLAGNGANIFGLTNSLARWQLTLGTAAAESGSNAGSNFQIANFTDAGVIITVPLAIARASSIATFAVAIVNGPSDRALKENIVPIEGALATVKALRGVRFNFRGKDADEIGLIAQDVEPVVPEVIQDFDPGEERRARNERPLKAIDYPKLVALLIEAVKELAGEVEALKAA